MTTQRPHPSPGPRSTGQTLLEEIQLAQEQLLAAEVDRTLLSRNLSLTPVERIQQHDAQLKAILALREAPRIAV